MDEYDKILTQINSVLTVSLNHLIGNSLGVRGKELLEAIVDEGCINPDYAARRGENALNTL